MTLVSTPALAGKYAGAVAAAGGLQGRVMWVDAEANLGVLQTRAAAADLVCRCKEANINALVVDVKPLSGLVLYKSRIAPRLKEFGGQPYPQDFDLLQAAVEEGHRAGVEVYAAINVFSEGRAAGGCGAVAAHPEWQCIKYEVDRWVSGAGEDSYPLDGVNRTPLQGRMSLLTDPKFMPANIPADLQRVAVDAGGKVTASVLGPALADSPFLFPPGGYVILASGPAGAWLAANAKVGGTTTIEGKTRLVPMGMSADEHVTVFVNPANPEVRSYELSIISEIAANYDVDGIVFDRMRYPGMYADFSDLSRAEFEKWLGGKVERFPEDIFTINPLPGRDVMPGKYFAKWMEWRARQIHDFAAQARQVVKSVKPKALVAAYVGSWYGSYYDVGVNWASPTHQPPYEWAEPSYKETGYADLLDWICTGCYYQYPTRQEAKAAGASEFGSVEAAAQESNDVVEDDTFVYGSLYLLLYARDPAAFERAIAVCNANTQGVMLFDLCYVRDYNWWDLLKKAFSTPTKPPHAVPGLIEKVKEVRRLVESVK